MKKQLLITGALLFTSLATFAQNTWYDHDAGTPATTITVPATGCAGCSVTFPDNPDAGDIANAAKVTLLELAVDSGAGNRSFIVNFPSGLGVNQADVEGLVITIRLYIPSFADVSNFDSAERFRFYLNSSTGLTQQQVNIVVEDQGAWKEFTFTYPAVTIGFVNSAEIRLIGNNFTNLTNGLKIYVDTIKANKALATDSSLSTNKFDLESFQLFPNPTADSFQIITEESIKSVTLTNVAGQLVKTFTPSENYNISDLNAGIYFATVTSDNGSQTVKIVKK